MEKRVAQQPRPWLLPALLLGAVVGSALQLQQPALWRAGTYGGVLVAAIAMALGALTATRMRARANAWMSFAPLAIAFAAGGLALFALGGLRSADYLGDALAPQLEGRDIRVTGMVAAMPQSNEAGTRLRLDVESALLQGAPVQLPPRIEVAWYGGAFRDAAGVADLQRPPPALRAGERWDLTVRLKAPHGLRNPHGFDLMSISGLHITLFAWLAALAVRALWRRSTRLCLRAPAQSVALAAGVLLAAGYALFSGWGVPAQRTVIMLAAIALLQLSGRRWPWPQVWLLACAAVVVADPWALAQAGFWLSFVAVGVLFATNSIAGGAHGSSGGGHFRSLLREQWVVTLALTPLGVLLFGQVSLVGFAANLVAIPWVTLVVTLLALGGVLWAPLWSLAALALQPLAALLQWLAQWPWAVVFLPVAPLWAGVAAVAGGALLATRLPWRLRLLALPLLWPLLAWQPARPAAGQFELLAADIGQGNAVLVRTATHTLLYDAGPRFSRESDAGHRVLVPLLRALGERVDVLMLSHRDIDHTGGAAAVLAQQPQAELTGSIEADHALQALRPVKPCLQGQRW
ncbi:MAG: DUF4131 domain-containing protein, partial [Acidovorax sp.]